jgi:hypothetical protein
VRTLWACACIIVVAASTAQAANRLLEKRESLYNNIYVYSDGDTVTMTFGLTCSSTRRVV